MRDAIDLDLKAYFDTVRHDLLLNKIAKRVKDPEILKLCKAILKSGGKIGLPQGSVVGPLFANLFLNEIDKMLEKAQEVTKIGRFETIRYARFADDLVVLFSVASWAKWKMWPQKVFLRLRQELDKLSLTINDEKTKFVRLEEKETLEFLGFSFRFITSGTKKDGGYKVIQRPQRKKRTALLREISATLKKNRFKPIEEVVQKELNPKLRGWVNYFRHGNSGKDLNFVKWQVEVKVRKFASRQRPKNRGGRRWTKWSHAEIYEKWGLYSDYRVIHGSEVGDKVT